jgi:hypothetical protein
MQDSSVPPKIQIPWANSAGSANIRTVPQASQLAIQAGAASFTDGFVPLNFVPVSAGGVPPFGQDFNGILQLITQWLRWGSAGGAIRYDAGFVAAIGGYPIGSRLMSNSGHVIYESLVDNNSGDPNAGATNWRVQSSVWSLSPWQAAGSANIQTVSLNPVPASTAQLSGIPITLLSQGTNTGAVTLNVNGLGALPIVTTGGVPLLPGVLVTSYPFTVRLLGSAFVMMSNVLNPLGIPRSGSFGLSGSLGGLGATNWTVPAAVFANRQRVWGAGGGGAGSSSGQGGGGGGGGAYSEGIYSVTPGQVLAVFVGSGGVAGPPGSTGATGGSSFVTGFLQAGGGVGGSGATPWAGGTGGVPAGGNVLNLTGGHGGGGISGSTGAGGGGGGSPMGGAGDAASAGAPGSGAVSPGGGGAGFGGGGAGTGSPGASGIVLFDW